MPHVRREEALVRAARRRQALSLRLWWAIGMLAVLGGWLVWREHEAVLGSVVERASATAAHEAATLAERQRDAATLVAQRLASPPVGRSAVPAGPRTPGADALEYILTDEASRLAIGGVLEVAGASPAPGVRDVALAAVAAQRAVLDATPGLEAVYVAFPEARIVSRVPYVGAEQLRVRTRDARLAPWFTGAFLEDAVHDELVDGSPVIADEPATGVPVLRLDRPVAGIARGIRARVIVTVPVEAYLEAAARTEYPVRAVSGLVAPDGTVVAARAPGAAASAAATTLLPTAVLDARNAEAGAIGTGGGWYAVRAPVPGTRLGVLVAVRATAVWARAVRAAAPGLGLVALCGVLLGMLARAVRTRVLGSAEDEADRLAADAVLLREVTDGVPGLAVFKVHRDDTGITLVDHVSRGAAAVLGVPAVAIASDWTHAFESVVPEMAAQVREQADRALADGVAWQQEFRVRRRDEERWVRVEARATRTDTGVELVGAWRDVTETRVHTELLADAHRRLVELADGVPGAVLQWRVTDDGRQVVAFVGNRLPEIAGIPTADLYHGLHAFEQVQLAEDVDEVRRARQQAVAARGGYAVEYRVMHPSRGLRWLREEAVHHEVAGCLAAFTVHITDVTQQREEALVLRRAKEEAEQATRAKSVFLATMSHEIRTPMTGISGMLEVLQRTVLDADQRQQLGTVADSARALRRILDDVLDFSRIEAGKMTIERRPMSVDDVVEATAGLYVGAAEEKGVQLRTTVDPRIGELVMGDAVRLRQVLGNLLSNAVKFTPRGSVRLSVTQEGVDDHLRTLTFEVTDTGVGIPYDVQPRLFAPFERGEHEVTTQVGGTGLGLALVQRIVDLMDGTVALRSLPGVGTSVQVRIPFERLHEETSDARISLAGVRVMVLHENGTDAKYLATLCQDRGALVTVVAPDAAAAVPEGSLCDVIVTGPEAPREAQLALRGRIAPAASGRVGMVRLFGGASVRPEVRGDGGVVLAPHARRSAIVRAVAIAVGRDEPDLPAMTPEHRPTPEREVPTVAEAIAQRRLILVCEDHPIAQRVIEKQLRVLGYTAELHNNGASGFAAWRSGRYGLVLTDLHMPELDGLGLARRIRAEEGRDPSLGRTPIIALSGNAFDEQRVVCVEAGMDDFLAKPAALKELDATLRFWLPPSVTTAGELSLTQEQALPVTLPAPLSHKALKEALGDDPDVLRAALGEFLAADAEDVAALLESVRLDDRPRVVGSAHRIEGAARMLGATPYARAAERVKRLFGLDQDPAERADAVRLLEQESERLRTWLHTTRDWFERAAAGAGA